MRQLGFTLVELLIAIGVIAVLSAGLVAIIGPGPRQSARDGRRQADIQKISAALELYRSDNGGYPASCVGGGCLTTLGYMGSTPTDPVPPRVYQYNASGCVGGLCNTYTLCADLERTTSLTCPNDYVVRNP